MRLLIHARLDYAFEQPTDVLVQLEAAITPDQRVEHAFIDLPRVEHFRRIPGHDGIGDRIQFRTEGRLIVDYRSRVVVARPAADLAALPGTALHDLPVETLDYMVPSRYCPSDQFEAFAEAEFAGLDGGARVEAIRDFVARSLTYEPGASTGATTALETFATRRGVCRDYAHLVVTLARACGIPARVASGYAPGVRPPDFHLVAEAWLAGAWHPVDATGMATADTIARIGVGRDAADVAFLTSWGDARLLAQSVEVQAG